MHRVEKLALDAAIGEIIAYIYMDDELLFTFIDHGTHDNFYRDLKRSS